MAAASARVISRSQPALPHALLSLQYLRHKNVININGRIDFCHQRGWAPGKNRPPHNSLLVFVLLIGFSAHFRKIIPHDETSRQSFVLYSPDFCGGMGVFLGLKTYQNQAAPAKTAGICSVRDFAVLFLI